METRGVTVEVHHIREVKPAELPQADLYVFSAPGRMGRPIGGMRRFLKKLKLPAGTPYAVLTTEMAPRPDKQTGQMPAEDDPSSRQRVRPIMNEILQRKGLDHLADDAVHVTGMKGPLEQGWQEKVDAFAALVATRAGERAAHASRESSVA
jgi:hypothetical protein